MQDDVLVNKAAIIEKCLQRIEKEYANNPVNIRENITRQDAIVFNLQRACEAAIDMAMHLVRKQGLGVPQESREAFEFLAEAGLIPKKLAQRLQSMVGFRNIAVHDYQSLNLDILQSILEKHLNDFRQWVKVILQKKKSGKKT
ncbi:MAG: DUF86 domain-containing protein [Deltaproteobacteria bacterium]|nr:DUF86 domain-containing protein [Deltaproteobacteria bacterium]